MLRWKIFVPLAVILTLSGIGASRHWAASTSHQQISAIQQPGLIELSEEEDKLLINLAPSADLEELLARLDIKQVETVLADRKLCLERTASEPMDAGLIRRVDLILAQAVATGQYFFAESLLEELAEEWGCHHVLIIWGDRLVAEISDERSSYIVIEAMGCKP